MIHAKVTHFDNKFIAALSDGRQVEHADFRALAYALYCAAVLARNVQYEWSTGHRMITAGQQADLCAEMRRLEREYGGQPVSLSIAA